MKGKMNKKKRIAFGIGIVLAVLAVLTASALADNEVYFVPDPSCTEPSNTTVVTMRMNITDGVASFGCDVYFDLDVVNITSGAPGDLPTMWLFSHKGDWVRFGGWSETYLNLPPGDYKLADLTLVANNTGTSALHFDPVWSLLSDHYGITVPTTWNDGTFLCPETSNIALSRGWNMISLPLEPLPGNDSVDKVLGTVYYDEVYRYDATSHIFVDASDDTMEPGVGYFVHIASPCTWTYNGTPYTNMNISLKWGLNLIGWLNCSKPIAETNLSNSSLVFYIAGWNVTTQEYGAYTPGAPPWANDFDMMDRGTGYFVSAETAFTLTENCS